MIVHDRVPHFFMRTNTLTEIEISNAQKILKGALPFNIYFNSALSAKEQDGQSRWIHFSNSGGLTLGIDFDDLRVFSTIGSLDDDVIAVIGSNPRRTEFHVPFKYVESLKKIGDKRLTRENRLRYYSLHRTLPFTEDFKSLKRLTSIDLKLAKVFYSKFYSGTIFSSWMLDQPFWGCFAGTDLVAAGGAIAVDPISGAANIGNFLTAPNFRKRGLGKLVAKRLINNLIELGIHTFTLGTTEENIAAWKTYESLGFSLLEQRAELEFSSRMVGK